MRPLTVLEAFGRAGFIVSIACGPNEGSVRWSVLVRSPDGKQFEKPFAAHTFGQAVRIAEREIAVRGWAR